MAAKVKDSGVAFVTAVLSSPLKRVVRAYSDIDIKVKRPTLSRYNTLPTCYHQKKEAPATAAIKKQSVHKKKRKSLQIQPTLRQRSESVQHTSSRGKVNKPPAIRRHTAPEADQLAKPFAFVNFPKESALRKRKLSLQAQQRASSKKSSHYQGPLSTKKSSQYQRPVSTKKSSQYQRTLSKKKSAQNQGKAATNKSLHKKLSTKKSKQYQRSASSKNKSFQRQRKVPSTKSLPDQPSTSGETIYVDKKVQPNRVTRSKTAPTSDHILKDSVAVKSRSKSLGGRTRKPLVALRSFGVKKSWQPHLATKPRGSLGTGDFAGNSERISTDVNVSTPFRSEYTMSSLRSSVRPKSSKQKWGTILQPEFGLGYQKMTSYEVQQSIDRLYYVPERRERIYNQQEAKEMKSTDIQEMIKRLTKTSPEWVPDSKRTQKDSMYKQMGVVNSYAWKGYN